VEVKTDVRVNVHRNVEWVAVVVVEAHRIVVEHDVVAVEVVEDNWTYDDNHNSEKNGRKVPLS
jgi:hypothetical protein